MPDISARLATEDDKQDLFDWRNDPLTCSMFNNTDMVEWDGHVKWLKSTIERDDRVLVLGLCEGDKVGTVRYDLTDDHAQVTITINPAWRGKKMATPLFLAAEQFLPPHINSIHAEIKDNNIPSIKSCEKAGYNIVGQDGSMVILIKPLKDNK